MSETGSPTGAVIALMPAGKALVAGSDDEQPLHVTLKYLGDAADLSPTVIEHIRDGAQQIATTFEPFTAKVSGVAYLGEDKAVVALVEHESIQRAYETLCEDEVLETAGAEYAYPSFVPHVTLAYGQPLDEVDAPSEFLFNRVALMLAGETTEFPLTGSSPSPVTSAARSLTPAERARLEAELDAVEMLFAEAYAAALNLSQPSLTSAAARPRALARVTALFRRALEAAATLGLSRLLRRARLPDDATSDQPSVAALPPPVKAKIERRTAELAAELAKDAVASAPADAEPSHWAETRARTAATTAVSRSVLETAPLVAELEGVELNKVWVSRGDERVRPLHRDLHGKSVALDQPFWRELSSGSKLSYPGDPDGPPGQVYGCRCFIWLGRADETAQVEEALSLAAAVTVPAA